MAAAGCVRSRDQFLCPICLDVFTDPVTIPCGHNFCKSCISENWKVKEPYQCPMCKEKFRIKPRLKINTFIKEMVSQFRHEAQHDPNVSSSDQQAAKPEEVPCDICPEPRLKALKSCLVCLTSYCQTHLEPHLTRPGLKQHQLIHPVENLEDRMCKRHKKPLELSCRTNHTCICTFCPVVDHKNHKFVPMKDEYEKQKTELKKTDAEIHQMIQERRLKIQEIQRSVELSQNAADRETADGVKVFTALMESVQKSLDQLIEEIQEKQRTAKKQAEDFIKELEQEICELKKRSTEVEQLSDSENHLHFVQRFKCVKAAPPMKTWTKVSVRPPSYEGTVERAVSKVEDKLKEKRKKVTVSPPSPPTIVSTPHQPPPAKREKKNNRIRDPNQGGKDIIKVVRVCRPSNEGTLRRVVSELENKLTEEKKKMKKKMFGAELKTVQEYEVDVTLDPDTAHPYLILSDDRKQVHDGNVNKNLPDNRQRFNVWPFILAKQRFSSGRFYFEVQVKGKTKWTLGVVRESINRKGKITLSPQNGYWVICLRNGNEYQALADPSVCLSLKSGLQKVGVFVDYEEGLVSFYDVDSSVLIYSFIGCCFSDKLLPFVSPCNNDGGKNSAPLIITPVDNE